MATFPFPHISEKKKFQFTFLNEVAVKFIFTTGDKPVSYDTARRFFKELFNLDFKETHYESMLNTRLKVRNEGMGFMFEFSKDTVKISIDQDHYSTFQTSMLSILKTFLNSYKLLFDRCEKLELKYVDVWPFADNSHASDADIKALEDAVFSNSLRETSSEMDDNFRGFKCDNEEFSIVLKYGYYLPKNKNLNSGMALESRCELLHDEIKIDRILDVVQKMNNLLYDSFIWAVTPAIIEAMTGELKE